MTSTSTTIRVFLSALCNQLFLDFIIWATDGLVILTTVNYTPGLAAIPPLTERMAQIAQSWNNYNSEKETLHTKLTMPRITLEISEELSEQLAQLGHRLPELLALTLQQPALPAHIYRYVLDFLASNPTPQKIAEFKPTSEMQERLRILLTRSKAGELTPSELKELDEYERIEHLVVMIKAGNLNE